MNGTSGFVYLNLANQWPTFQRHGIDVTLAGSLALTGWGGAYALRGGFRGGPFTTPEATAPWFRLLVQANPLPAGTHVQLYTFAGG